ncbi:hypothetical protein HAX54_030179 [Datura stramonium]|uniref:Uncharacterized protein n=1 Tax=Datura stramonium TaxID=4076 RepID=A0ABS8V9C4_DATST|nr:hypothetical protein [Datura stramonium]
MLHVIDMLEPCIGEEYQEQLLGILGIVKDNVTDCYKLVQEVASNIDFNSNKRKFAALPESPIGVMDVSFSSDSSTTRGRWLHPFLLHLSHHQRRVEHMRMKMMLRLAPR